MVDSDDEYDRKRRDKFRGERSSGDSYRSDRRGDDRRREEWSDRNPFRSGRARPDYRDYRGPREKYSPGRELPPAKRMRPDWGEDIRPSPRYGGYDQYLLHNWAHDHYPAHGMHPYHMPASAHPREMPQPISDVPTQPAMLTLKQFLDTQEDGISDADVLRKYSEYKLEFKRQQLNEFFVAHKDEEWFKSKYHPTESVKRKQEQRSFLKRRAEVFNELLDNGTVSNVTLDSSQSDQLLRLLDTVVIKLEGGTDEDLKVLDEPLPEVKFPEKTSETVFDHNNETKDIKPKVEVHTSPKRVSPRRDIPTNNDDEENWDEDDTQEPTVSESKFKTEKETTKKRSHSESSSSSSSNSGDENDAAYPKPDSSTVDKDNENENGKMEYDSGDEREGEAKSEVKNEAEKSEKPDPAEASPDRSKKTPIVEEKNEDDDKDSEKDKVAAEKVDDSIEKIEISDNNEPIDVDKEKPVAPKLEALHRTSSIFLRNLAPAITKAEIETICQRFAGFLRVAIADPLAERRWFRRGWVTFKRDVNIKEICWNLNNTRLRDCEIGAIVNRDLSRRVRPVNGITAHKTIVRSDIKLCAKIALNLDEKYNLWDEEKDKEKDDENTESNKSSSYGFKTNNPVLQNITDFLIEEASAEEDELLGIAGDNKDATEGETIEREPQIISVLDKLILYLRVVHSVDFYNHCEYPYEDEMPNRCGIIHTRGPIPQNKVTVNEIQDYIKNFESKMQAFLTKPAQIEEEELKNLGLKDQTTEVEKFVQANTQELAKDKWLCPLSGKKFKGPEFIRKHIFNKHGDKVDEVRKEVEYFNNYLKDPKRPQLPEHSGNARRTNSESSGPPGFRQAGGYMAAGYPPPYGAYAPPMIIPSRGSARGFGGGRRDLPLEHHRRVIGYHDLDAPANFDIFD